VNWLTSLWDNTIWPSLLGNGPEDFISLVIVGVLGALIWPPTRRRIEVFAKRHVTEIKAHVTAEHAAVHAKLDHVIKHSPDIPPFPTKESKP
jgi:hypothetical protein